MDSRAARFPSNTCYAHHTRAGLVDCRLVSVVVLGLIAGCASPDARTSRAQLAAELQDRTWHDVPASSRSGDVTLPPEVCLDDGLSQEEAVAIALWNNAQFHATLSQLGMARGDIVQAGLLTNPQFLYLFSGGDKQLEYALFLPLEALFFRAHRITIAEREYCRIAEELVQNGLNLVRDVRVAYADLVFAVDRAALAEEATRVRARIADLSQKRLDAGDISELEAATARIDALNARAADAGLREQVVIARERLANLLGIGLMNVDLMASDRHSPNPTEFDPEVLLADALLSRPDLRAAQYAIAAADQQARLSRWTWLRIDAAVDGNARGSGPTNVGPGIRFDVPIFNRNQGGIIRSDWTTDQAIHNFDAVRDRVVMEVRTAAAQLTQAEVSLAILQHDVLPSLEQAVEVAENAYRNGGTTYFLALQTTTQFVDTRARELELTAAADRALAELERSVGRRLVPPIIAADSGEHDETATETISTPSEVQQCIAGGVAAGPDAVHNASEAGTTAALHCPRDFGVVKASHDHDRPSPLIPERPAESLSGDGRWPSVFRWVAIDDAATGDAAAGTDAGRLQFPW